MDFTLILVIATLITGIFSIVSINNIILRNIREFSSSVFPILLVVLIIRSFFIEPYKIPSGSMIPTLMIGDFILVDKNIYGYKLPLTDITLIDNEDPERGDVVDFKYSNGDLIRMWCVNWSEKVEKNLNYGDNFSISLTPIKHMNWINNEAY